MPVAFAVLTLSLFSDALVVPHRVPAIVDSDLRRQTLYWREFGFDQIRAGRFALWNPYSFCGTPFFGDPQSAMLYPPNWLNLILSPEKAADWLIVIHFFLAAYFTGLWCRSRSLSVIAATMAGTLYACSGPIISNLRPGHLSLLCSAAWAPLLFRCVDGLFEDIFKTRWLMLGIAVVTMLAVDGYPQFAYYTGLAVGLYVLLRLPGARHRMRIIASVAIMFSGAAALAAAQIIASAQVAGESIRAGGLPYDVASTFSLPPESLLTLLAPALFGDGKALPYYARWNWWETCMFLGPAALALAALGASQFRKNRLPGTMALAMFVLAIGAYTPIYPLLYDVLPGFNSFRATDRFGLLGILFVSLLAAGGWDHLSDRLANRPRRVVIIVMSGLGILLAWAAAWISNSSDHMAWVLQALDQTGQVLRKLPPSDRALATLVAQHQLLMAAVFTILTAGLLTLYAWRRNTALIGLVILAMGQVIWFAASERVASDAPASFPPDWAAALSHVTPDQRVLEASGYLSEAGPQAGFFNVAGYNPLVLGRTARFLAATQQADPESVGIQLVPRFLAPIYRMCRCALVTTFLPNGPIASLSDPLPHLLLLGECQQTPDPDSALAAVLDRNFDPAQSVVLESRPDPAPQPSANAGTVRLVNQTTDELEIEADLLVPQVLLVTDAFSQGWHVVPLETSAQAAYQVMPADYCLRAIPLAAGHHHFRLEYRPEAVVVGMRISLAALGTYMAAMIWLAIARPIHPAVETSPRHPASH